ncbi:beta-1,3-glucosyltransferase isoform X2 [Coccinella septempunctata]|uniref:beta-1,3-glucosyltransferase isoform X2 n=1 Tax=Coccinella septempunctata TaxID=41139 RepID=UPI001D0953F7|nr:beta-1,3-glucosyltransferase isoform X2 [Coccinella septempunctata]
MRSIGLLLLINEFIFIKGDTDIRFSFVILSQENDYHFGVAKNLKAQICDQALVLKEECPPIYFSHVDFPHVGDWTLVPILNKIYDVARNSSWLIILEERSMIRLDGLKKLLGNFDEKKELWIGHALEDENPTIIHHFLERKFKYPHMGAGVAISVALLKRLSDKISLASKLTDFNIDKSFELALFIWNELNKTSLIHNDAFCTSEKEFCVSFPRKFATCKEPIPLDSIYFIVKTCLKFHSDRVPVVLSTWAKYTKRLDFISDYEDSSIPTVSLGIPNTEGGHCGKTMAIMKYLNDKLENDYSIRWIVITDDDTILSVQRITELLSCYDPNDDVAVGERYGYGLYNSLGFNYITGGGGMVFSRTLLKKLSASCKCPSISAPDDMILGHCLADLGVKITHSHLFHQARPTDYSMQFLESDRHVSFHKHWMLDPIKVYREWFEREDKKLVESHSTKIEL